MFKELSSIQVIQNYGVRGAVERDVGHRSAVLSLVIDSGGRLDLAIDPRRDDLCVLDVNLTLAEGADVRVFISVRGIGEESFRCKTVQSHVGGRSSSRVEVRCAVEDRAVVDYRGEIEIPSGLTGVCAEQRCRGLVLSEDARVNAVPAMKVASKDSACVHGVAVGGVDPDVLMYFSSRGIDYAAAKAQIVDGFLSRGEWR